MNALFRYKNLKTPYITDFRRTLYFDMNLLLKIFYHFSSLDAIDYLLFSVII